MEQCVFIVGFTCLAISCAAAFLVRAAKAIVLLGCQNGNALVSKSHLGSCSEAVLLFFLYAKFAHVQVLATPPHRMEGVGWI